MKSKIVDMVEAGRDAGDRWLEAVFVSDVVPDDGFSDRIVRRIRRRLRVRRWSLGIAVAFGTFVAAQPVVELATLLVRALGQVTVSLGISPGDSLPSAAMLLGGGALFLVTVLGLRLLDH